MPFDPGVLGAQLRLGMRRLVRRPLFGLTCVGTLALGIGATVATFSIVHGVLLEPLPFEDGERLVAVWNRAPAITAGRVNPTVAMFLTYRDASRTFIDLGLWRREHVVVTGVDEPEQVPAVEMTESLLAVLGVPAALGRPFSDRDDSPGAPETAMLGHDYWLRRFGGDRTVVGRSLLVDGRPREVIGVLPPAFELPDGFADLYLPAQIDPTEVRGDDFSSQAIGRLRPGVSVEAANADADRLVPLSTERFPGMEMRTLEEMRFSSALVPLLQEYVGEVGTVLWILLGTAGIVLLIASANVANLFLVRAEGRKQELALRTSLGAGWLAIAQLFLAESLGVAILGGACGVGLAFAGLVLLRRLGPDILPRIAGIEIDGAVLLFSLAISILTGLALGLVPTLRQRHLDVIASLKEGGRGSVGESRHRARRVLVVTQIAMTLVLLVGSGLMIRTFQRLRSVPPGFADPTEVLTFRVTVPEAEITTMEEVALAYERIQRSMEAIPGVASVGASQSITMDGEGSNDAFFIEDFPMEANQVPPVRRVKWITPGYFGTMENSLLVGRGLEWRDIHDRSPVVVVTANLANEYWARPTDAIGKRISIAHTAGRDWREIVGVVGDVHDDGVHQAATATVYWPLVGHMQNRQIDGLFVPRSLAFAVRSPDRDPRSLVPDVVRAVGSVNGNLPIADVSTLQQILDRSLARTTFTLTMLLVSAALALALGMVGIYAVMSYIVTKRKRELGVRMAFGAGSRAIVSLVLSQGLRLAVLGVVVGVFAAVALTRLMSSLLFGVDPADPPTYAAVVVLLCLMVLLACYLPARRASRVSPVEALHSE